MLHLFGAHFVGNHLQQMLWCVQMNVPMFDLIFLLKLIHVRLYLRSTAKAIDICFKEISTHTFFANTLQRCACNGTYGTNF